jgi:DNA-binding SARP family transcriptional activator/TolB-like protein/Tfp pilus assembly protein PilF
MVSLFDSFSTSYAGRAVPIKNKKAQALLGYLLLTPSRRETRERLCGLLWSESEEEKARGSLRQVLHHLRETFERAGFDGLTLGRDEISLDPSKLDVDVWAVEQRVQGGGVHPLLLDRKRLPESLLAGLDDIDPSFRLWLIVQRQALQERIERHLDHALGLAGDDLPSVKPVANALLNLDPTHEAACRRLMQAYAESGDIAGALKTYKALWDLLENEYDSEPSEQTQDLVVRIKRGEFQGKGGSEAAPPVRLGLPPPQESPAHSRALRPETSTNAHNFLIVSEFDSRGVDKEHAYLVHALRHELISKLVRFRDWSVMDAAPRELPPSTDDVPTRYFSIDATVRQSKATLALTLTLKECPYGRYIWSDSYGLDLERWFDVQQAVISRLALALNVHLSVERLMAVARRPDVSLSVFDRWLRGQELLFAWDPESWKRATQLFQSIIEDAPQFAPAYVGLVRLKNQEHLVFPGIMRSQETQDQALELGRTAVQADPFDARAHHCFAWSLALGQKFEQAELSFGLALDLNANDPWTVVSSSLGTAYCGEHRRGLELADRALRIDPNPSRSHWGYQTQTRFLCEDYAGAADAAARAQDHMSFVPAWHAAALSHLGRREEAAEKARGFLQRCRANWHGAAPPTDEAIASWLLNAFPIREQADWERLRDGLRLADVPVSAELAG